VVRNAVKFEDTLQLTGAGNVMRGPARQERRHQELCAWVYQRKGSDDAAATEMSTTAAG